MDGWGEMMDGRPTYDDLILPAQWTSLAARSTPTKTLWGEVLAQAVADLAGKASGVDSRQRARLAEQRRAWLADPGQSVGSVLRLTLWPLSDIAGRSAVCGCRKIKHLRA